MFKMKRSLPKLIHPLQVVTVNQYAFDDKTHCRPLSNPATIVSQRAEGVVEPASVQIGRC
jgi:hypothetical protein